MREHNDADGGWMAIPTAETAVSHATPFPDFGTDALVGMAVYDSNMAQIRRAVEGER